MDEIAKRLATLNVIPCSLPTQPGAHKARAFAIGQRIGVDVPTFLAQYPIWLNWPEADVYHLTVQTYASALMFNPPPGPVVVTVHDIIPYLVRRNHSLNVYRHPAHRVLDWLAMQGIKRSNVVIADSAWTKQSLLSQLDLTPDRIAIVPLGVDHDRYRPLPVPATFRSRYGISESKPYLLYVGSEDRRKNLEELWRALALLRPEHRDLELLKVGAGYLPAERRRLEALAGALGIADAIRFFDHVPEDDLRYFYNIASAFVMPSLYEGFGLPVVEALACGSPVVCSNASALPEIANADVLLCEPTAEGISECLQQALADGHTNLQECRVGHAANFSWERTAQQTRDVYLRAAGI